MREKIRVAQLVYNLQIEKGGGGLTRAAIEIAEWLDPDHFDRYVICLGGYNSTGEIERIQELRNKYINVYVSEYWQDKHPYISFVRSLVSMSKYIVQERIQIIHSHSEFTDIVAIFLKLFLGLNIIRTVHYGYKLEWRNKPLRRIILTNFLYPLLYDLEVGVNPSIVERLNNRAFAKIMKKKSIFISEGINLHRIIHRRDDKSVIKSQFNIPSDAIVIGAVGRLVEQKGHRYLIEAVSKLNSSTKDIYYIIAGDGELREELKLLSSQLGLDDRIIFAGAITKIENILHMFDIFVQPSLWEGLPIAVLESMAAMVPVVATDIPGSNYIIENGVNGLLVPPADSESLSNAILLLVRSPDLRKKIAQNACISLKEFRIENIVRQYSVIYQNLVD